VEEVPGQIILKTSTASFTRQSKGKRRATLFTMRSVWGMGGCGGRMWKSVKREKLRDEISTLRETRHNNQILSLLSPFASAASKGLP